MSTRHRVPLTVALSAAALLVAGCSSSGTVGESGGSSGGKGSSGGSSSGGLLGGSSGDSSGGSSGDSSGGSSGGSGMSDAGCATALGAIQNAMKLQHSTDKAAAYSGLQTSIRQLHTAAGKTKVPGAKDAMNQVADDLSGIIDSVKSGKSPDTSQALTDASKVAELCGAG